jgi:hypothetical protein
LTVWEEAEHLLEEASDRDLFAILAKTAEKGHKEHLDHLDLINVMDKEGHTSSPGDPLVGRLDLGDFPLAFVALPGSFAHRIPHFLDESF